PEGGRAGGRPCCPGDRRGACLRHGRRGELVHADERDGQGHQGPRLALEGHQDRRGEDRGQGGGGGREGAVLTCSTVIQRTVPAWGRLRVVPLPGTGVDGEVRGQPAEAAGAGAGVPTGRPGAPWPSASSPARSAGTWPSRRLARSSCGS